jgi:hypothetical protein
MAASEICSQKLDCSNSLGLIAQTVSAPWTNQFRGHFELFYLMDFDGKNCYTYAS